MITLLKIAGDRLPIGLIILYITSVIVSANILLRIWKIESEEKELSVLSYIGAWTFSTFLSPIVCGLSLLHWLSQITPSQSRKWFGEKWKVIRYIVWDNTMLGWGWNKIFGKTKAKQAPPQVNFGSTQFYVNPNPQAIYTKSGPPYINDLLNVTAHTSSLAPNHVNAAGIPHPNLARGRRSGPNSMTRLSNGSGAPSWYVPAPPPAVAKKAAK